MITTTATIISTTATLFVKYANKPPRGRERARERNRGRGREQETKRKGARKREGESKRERKGERREGERREKEEGEEKGGKGPRPGAAGQTAERNVQQDKKSRGHAPAAKNVRRSLS